MENVLDVYTRPYDAQRPLICLDENPYVLHKDTIKPLATRSKSPQKIDYEYERHGYCAITGLIEPLTGKQFIDVRLTRKATDFAQVIAWLVDECYPQAAKIVLVMDNLNTHTAGSLYKQFPPAKAKRLWDKLEVHHTPKHGSWLNIAEIGLNLFSKQCLGQRRIPTLLELNAELQAWCHERNQKQIPVQWHFTTQDARIKLRSLYPKLPN